MIDTGDVDVNTPSECPGKTAVHHAAELGNEEFLDELLKRNGDISRGDYCGINYTPLLYAIMA
jgi:ankyrin repeat protein